MWGDLKLLEFYPRNWQSGMLRTMHPWLLHMSIWHYWLWFSFLISMTLYFVYVFKALTYNRADIRLIRSSGDKRRNAWSEILTVIFPFIWSVNIISNAFAYLRLLEGSGGYTFISVQISAYQWGWRYCYSDSFYYKYWNFPIKTGYKTIFMRNSQRIKYPFGYKLPHLPKRLLHHLSYFTWNKKPRRLYRFPTLDQSLDFQLYSTWGLTTKTGITPIWAEVYLSRYWLKDVGLMTKHFGRELRNSIFQSGFWFVSQGLGPNTPAQQILKTGSVDFVQDPLRLLRSTGALILPARVPLRLMGTSEDITHSWAVPGLGIKMDCVPGRLFCLFTNITREGIYYGQCSELCGWNHYNMPVIVYSLPVEHFISWWDTELQSRFAETRLNRERVLSYELSLYKFK